MCRRLRNIAMKCGKASFPGTSTRFRETGPHLALVIIEVPRDGALREGVMNRISSAVVHGLFVFMLFGGATIGGEPVSAKGKTALKNFDYRGVTLDGGRMRMQLDEVRDDYLRIPNDDLLKGFRQRAGLPAPGKDLGGWYSGDVFHVFGQIVSGLSRLYAATGDPACREKVNALVAEWAKCIAPDGYFYYSAQAQRPALHLRQDGLAAWSTPICIAATGRHSAT